MSFALSAKYNSTAVTRSIQPTSIIFPPKRASSCSSKNNPTITAGIIDKTILAENFVSSFHLKEKSPFKMSTISFLKTTIVESAVAKCTTTVNIMLSSGTEVSPRIAFPSSK